MQVEELTKKVEELENRIRAMEDLEEIKKLHREFVHRMNDEHTDDGNRSIDNFTEDAVLDLWIHGIRRGKKEIAELAKTKLRQMTKRATDVLVQPYIEVKGDKAMGHWSLYMFMPGITTPRGKSLLKWEVGRLFVEYAKEGGKWKISFMKLTRPWPPLKDENLLSSESKEARQ